MSNSEEVGDFLQRMRAMSDIREKQDNERIKKLEEEVLQGRSERLARRAERARSLSPNKPTTPPASSSSPVAADTPDIVQEKAANISTPTMDPAQPPQDEEPKKPATSATALARSGTLSWQQRRPQSASIRRPLSLASPSAEAPPVSSPEPSPEAAPSRDQIAQSLGAKDPSWFKQTSDRGVGSAAYRRSQDDNSSETGSLAGRRQLPGMSRVSTTSAEPTSPPPESTRSIGSSHGRPSSTLIPGGDTDPARKVKSPLPMLESQKFAPPAEQTSSVDDGDQDRASARPVAMSPTQGRISPTRERSISPTKGMGGFVQSAILKRSDSVSKRWSAQAPAPLSRQNSTISNRGSTYGGTLGRPESRPTTLGRDDSTGPRSRPTSSSNSRPTTRDGTEIIPKEEFAKPERPRHSRSKSVASTFSDSTRTQDGASPSSPSKRWSPTKSSWLESALSKPESPKMKQAAPQQPAWMSELNRIKQQRGSVDLSGRSSLHSPSVESLASGRTSPIKDVQLRPVSLRRPDSPKKASEFEVVKPIESLPKPTDSPEPSPTTKPEPISAQEPPETTHNPEIPEATPDNTPKPLSSTARFSRDSPLSSPSIKPKPETPIKKDFRAGLRSRNTTLDDTKKSEVSELQSVFGKLKKTETKNYVAPDELKDNILRGKRGLSITGGPRPYVHRDDFRDSLISKKTAMLAKAQEEGSAALKKEESPAKPGPTPEALAMRKNLGRSDSISRVPPPPKEREREATPEALAKIQSLRSSKPVFPEKPAQPAASPVSKEPAKPNKFADRFNPGLAGLLARGPPPMATNPGGGSSDATTKSTSEEKQGPAPELTHMTKGRARGPKRRTPASKQATKSEEPSQKNEAAEVIEDKEAPAAAVPLVKAEHVLPSSSPKSFKTNNAPEETTRTPNRDSMKAKPATPVKSPRLSQRLEKSPSPELSRKPASLEIESKPSPDLSTPKKSPLAARMDNFQPSPSPELPKKPTSLEIESKPSPDLSTPKISPLAARLGNFQPSASPELPKKPASLEIDSKPSPDFSTPRKSPLAARMDKFQPSPTSSPLIARDAPLRGARPLQTPSNKPVTKALQEIPSPNGDISPKRDDISPGKSTFSVKNVSASWGRQSAASSPASTPVKSPIKLPTRADEDAAMESAGLSRSAESRDAPQPKLQTPNSSPVGLGLGGMSFGEIVPSKMRESSPPKPFSAKKLPATPAVIGDRPQSEPFKASPVPEKPQGIFDDFFDESPVTTGQLPENINTFQILQNPPLQFEAIGKNQNVA